MIPAFRLEIRRGRMLVLWLGAVAALYAGGITLFYPTIVANAADFEKLMEIYPKELMAAFGITGSLASQGTFLNSYIFSMIWPLVAGMAGIMLATRVAADAGTGFLDLPASTRLPRVRYLLAGIGAQAVAMAALAAAMVIAVEVVDLLIEPNFDVGRLALAGVHAMLFGFAILGITTVLAVLLLDRGKAAGLAAGILIAMYLVNVIAQLSPDMAGLADLSAFHYFDLKPLIEEGAYPVGGALLYGSVATIGWLLALVAFRRRDLVA
jgi:ABC-2 type transport system permease protein